MRELRQPKTSSQVNVGKVLGGTKPPILKGCVAPCEEKLKAKYEELAIVGDEKINHLFYCCRLSVMTVEDLYDNKHMDMCEYI